MVTCPPSNLPTGTMLWGIWFPSGISMGTSPPGPLIGICNYNWSYWYTSYWNEFYYNPDNKKIYQHTGYHFAWYWLESGHIFWYDTGLTIDHISGHVYHWVDLEEGTKTHPLGNVKVTLTGEYWNVLGFLEYSHTYPSVYTNADGLYYIDITTDNPFSLWSDPLGYAGWILNNTLWGIGWTQVSVKFETCSGIGGFTSEVSKGATLPDYYIPLVVTETLTVTSSGSPVVGAPVGFYSKYKTRADQTTGSDGKVTFSDIFPINVTHTIEKEGYQLFSQVYNLWDGNAQNCARATSAVLLSSSTGNASISFINRNSSGGYYPDQYMNIIYDVGYEPTTLMLRDGCYIILYKPDLTQYARNPTSGSLTPPYYTGSWNPYPGQNAMRGKWIVKLYDSGNNVIASDTVDFKTWGIIGYDNSESCTTHKLKITWSGIDPVTRSLPQSNMIIRLYDPNSTLKKTITVATASGYDYYDIQATDNLDEYWKAILVDQWGVVVDTTNPYIFPCDQVLHGNVYSLLGEPVDKAKVTIDLTEGGYPIDSFVGITGADGKYSITGFPPFTGDVYCYRKGYTRVTKQVTVNAHQIVRCDFTFGGTYLTCFDGTCTRLVGTGTSTCTNQAGHCDEQGEYHYECVDGLCVRIDEPGQDDCQVEGTLCDATGNYHLKCTNEVCTKVDGAGESDCTIEGEDCIDTHLVCQGGICTRTAEAGTDDCSLEGSLCDGSGSYHLECVDGTCTKVAGAEPSTCSQESAVCESVFHLQCIGGVCTKVAGAGVSDCTAEGGGCDNKHLECVDGICSEVVGSGTMTCTEEGNHCVIGLPGESHLDCISEICTKVDGAGFMECITQSNDCVLLGSHLKCLSNTCTAVNGPDYDYCTEASASCNPEVPEHLDCVSNVCTKITGEGFHTCNDQSNACTTSPEHLECNSNVCTKVAGSGFISCTVKNNACVLYGKHLDCVSSICTEYVGPGYDYCTKANLACDPNNPEHLECKSALCTVISGIGFKTCNTQGLGCGGGGSDPGEGLTGLISGTVKDEENMPIHNVYVIIEGVSTADEVTKTNYYGKYSIAPQKAGTYSMRFMKNNFVIATDSVTITQSDLDNGTNPQTKNKTLVRRSLNTDAANFPVSAIVYETSYVQLDDIDASGGVTDISTSGQQIALVDLTPRGVGGAGTGAGGGGNGNTGTDGGDANGEDLDCTLYGDGKFRCVRRGSGEVLPPDGTVGPDPEPDPGGPPIIIPNPDPGDVDPTPGDTICPEDYVYIAELGACRPNCPEGRHFDHNWNCIDDPTTEVELLNNGMCNGAAFAPALNDAYCLRVNIPSGTTRVTGISFYLHSPQTNLSDYRGTVYMDIYCSNSSDPNQSKTLIYEQVPLDYPSLTLGIYLTGYYKTSFSPINVTGYSHIFFQLHYSYINQTLNKWDAEFFTCDDMANSQLYLYMDWWIFGSQWYASFPLIFNQTSMNFKLYGEK